MVKGISRQIIVVDSPDPTLFDQAIFILKDGQTGITDEALLKEAGRLIDSPGKSKKQRLLFYGPAWAFGGALLTGVAWLLCAVF